MIELAIERSSRMRMNTYLLNFGLGRESEGRERPEARTQGKRRNGVCGREAVWFSVDAFYNKHSFLPKLL